MPDPPILAGVDIKRRTLRFPTRDAGLGRLAALKTYARLNQAWFAATGRVSEDVFGHRVHGLSSVLRGMSADVYIAHNIETLLPTMRAARGRAAVVFDCMEYYSDMGDAQSALEARAARALEAKFLRRCALVIASSENLADALVAEYGIGRPLVAYNVPPISRDFPPKRGGGLNLYWRNSVIGFGQRGLEDALLALSGLPRDIRLFVQGRLADDHGRAILQRAASLAVADRITLLAPYAPQDAVFEAAKYDVGLCLERKGPRNHDLTVSNKMFDYHMGGLAVVSSDLPSLRRVIDRSRGGLLFEPGNAQSLAGAIGSLYSSPNLLRELQVNARRFALDEANLETELDYLSAALREALTPRSGSLQRSV